MKELVHNNKRACSKIAYPDRCTALNEAKVQVTNNKHFKKIRTRKKNKKIYAYQCIFCKAWHLTSKKETKKQKRTNKGKN